jgi:hypothetical protein
MPDCCNPSLDKDSLSQAFTIAPTRPGCQYSQAHDDIPHTSTQTRHKIQVNSPSQAHPTASFAKEIKRKRFNTHSTSTPFINDEGALSVALSSSLSTPIIHQAWANPAESRVCSSAWLDRRSPFAHQASGGYSPPRLQS